MLNSEGGGLAWRRVVLVCALVLFFFAVPHTLEDFALGEPAKAGVPAPVLSLVVSAVLAVQALGLYALGGGKRWAFVLLGVVGVFWPVASGVAQLPVILSGEPYRSGAVSVAYVLGLLVTGPLLALSALMAWRTHR